MNDTVKYYLPDKLLSSNNFFFNDGKQLIEAIHLSEMSEAGLFWFRESLRFPDEEDGWENAVVYKREFGETMDE